VQQRSKVFLPVQYVYRENVKNAKKQNDQGVGDNDWIVVSKDECSDEFYDTVTHQPSDANIQNADTEICLLNDDDDISALDM